MRESGLGTSLILIVTGAILAFAVNIQTTGIDLNMIGVILIVVGVIGLLVSFLVLGDYSMWGSRGQLDQGATPPHTHRRVETTDVVYEDEDVERVERVRRVRR